MKQEMSRRWIMIWLIGILVSGCETYKTFYGEVGQDTTNAELRRIDLSYQQLQTIPDFSQIKELRMLDLSGNTALDIEATLQAIPNPEQLQVLRLDSLNLSKLPNLRRFNNLKQLSLIHNPDLVWDTVFRSLSDLNLAFLNLKHNGISALPSSITQLNTIRDLNLSHNHLIDIESYRYLSELPALYNLWLDHNKLRELPKTIGLLDQVAYLYINNNQLTALPEEFTGLKGIWVLHMGHNNFTELPEVLTEMKRLFLIHANNNRIAVLPEAYFTEDFSIMALILDKNQLPEEERTRIKKHFCNFFLLSLD